MQSPANYTMAFTPTWLYNKGNLNSGMHAMLKLTTANRIICAKYIAREHYEGYGIPRMDIEHLIRNKSNGTSTKSSKRRE